MLRKSPAERAPDDDLRSLDDSEIALPPLIVAATRFAAPLRVAAAALLVAFLFNGGLTFWTAGPLLSALLLLQGFVIVMLVLAAQLAVNRAGAGRDIARRNGELDEWKSEVEANRDSKNAVSARYYSPFYNIPALGKFIGWAPFALTFAALVTAIFTMRALIQPVPDVTSYGAPNFLGYAAAGINFAIAFGCVALGSWLKGQPRPEFPEARALGAWFKALQWSSLLLALSALTRVLGFDNANTMAQFADAWLGRILLLVVLGLALEQLSVAALAAVAKRKSWDEFALPFSAGLADNLFVSPRALAETVGTLEAKFGLNVRSSYVIARLRRTLPLVGLGVLGLLWLSSCLFTVATDETGVLTRFGKRVNEAPLAPGLHFKLPFPVDAIQTVPSERIKVVVVGAPLDTTQSVMWTKMHAAGDYNQVLGEGREVVSVHARIYYRIKDAQKYLFNTQNPDDAVSSYGYQVIMREVVSRDIDQLLSLDRVGFSERLKTKLQADLDAHNLGIEVVSFPLIGLHPPVDVARDYQSVVSAQIASITSATKANAERVAKVPAAQASRDIAIKKATGDGALRLGNARGEAAMFDATRAAYAAAPQDYQERLWMETMEDALAGKKIFVVDRKAQSPAPDYTVDLRPAGSMP